MTYMCIWVETKWLIYIISHNCHGELLVKILGVILGVILTDVDNLDINLVGYFESSFIMAEAGNLYTNLGVILNYHS